MFNKNAGCMFPVEKALIKIQKKNAKKTFFKTSMKKMQSIMSFSILKFLSKIYLKNIHPKLAALVRENDGLESRE